MQVKYTSSGSIYTSIDAIQTELAAEKAKLAKLETTDLDSQLDDGNRIENLKAASLMVIKNLEQELAFQRDLEIITLDNDFYYLFASHSNKKFYIVNNNSYFGVWFTVKEAEQLCKNLSLVSPLKLGVADHYKEKYQKMDSFHKMVETFNTKSNRTRLNDDLLYILMNHWTDTRGDWINLVETHIIDRLIKGGCFN